MSEQTTITIETLMEQAQVYASAWSLVDGIFDKGNQLEAANEEKDRLEEILEQFQEQVDAQAAPGNLQEIAEGLIAWHAKRIKNIDTILNVPKGTTVQLGKSDSNSVLLDGDLGKGFRIGLQIVREWFEPFPVSINRTSSADDDLDEEE